MRDYYNACVRLMRADYCGDGRGWTRDGTLVHLWANFDSGDEGDTPGLSYEAGWTSDGAVCVARTRIPEVLTTEGLRAVCPRLAAVPLCDLNGARHAGAILFNRSPP
jgi:hypothetical protein